MTNDFPRGMKHRDSDEARLDRIEEQLWEQQARLDVEYARYVEEEEKAIAEWFRSEKERAAAAPAGDDDGDRNA